VLFSVEDRAGDDYGAGDLVYPLHEVFEPGLFDLRRVHVWHDDAKLYFDVSFALVTNPWNAPEGFFHQLIDIYIDGEPGGYTEPAAQGPGVRFAPDAGWEYRLRIQPWAGSRWVDARSYPAKVYPVEVLVLPDGKTIRAEVPLEAAGQPSRGWRYYVLVGGFDTFGPDNYRAVEETPTQWSFGSTHSGGSIRVVDILDAGSGKRSQKAQLRAGEGPEGVPVLIPVDGGLSLPFTWQHLLASIVVLTLLGSMFLLLPRQKPPGQSG
jgi:carbohydrate-binding DOMON domain-containing protein